MDSLWLSFSLCDKEGTSLEGLSIELQAFSLHGLQGHDIVADLVHIDGEKERITLNAVPGHANWTTFFRLGSLESYIASFRLTGHYPANLVLSKADFHARCGVGRLLNSMGHFV